VGRAVHPERRGARHPGVWGHLAGGGQNPVDTAFIDRAVHELLTAEV
jgi:hypothetical protein